MNAITLLLARVDALLDKACAELKLEDNTAPFLVELYLSPTGEYSFKESDATEYFLPTKEECEIKERGEDPSRYVWESKDRLAWKLAIVGHDPSLKGVAFCFDGYALSVTAEESKSVPYDIKNVKNTQEALMAFLYMKDSPVMRSRYIVYKRNGDFDYWFGDNGWVELSKPKGIFYRVSQVLSGLMAKMAYRYPMLREHRMYRLTWKTLRLHSAFGGRFANPFD